MWKFGHDRIVAKIDEREEIGEDRMANGLIHKANELKPKTRAAVEAELGRLLKDDEAVSIMASAIRRCSPGGRTEAAVPP